MEPEPQQPTSHAIRVLVVDDSEIQRRLNAYSVTQLGWEVHTAADGAEAYKAIVGGGYHAVLMDCEMPVMDGFAATRAIRAHERAKGLPRVVIIAVTAAADWEACIRAGMDYFVPKSGLAQLPALLTRVLERIAPPQA